MCSRSRQKAYLELLSHAKENIQTKEGLGAIQKQLLFAFRFSGLLLLMLNVFAIEELVR